MKINHSAIRSTIKVIALTAFIASIMWRLYNLMRYGGSLDKTNQEKSGEAYDNDGDEHEDEDEDDGYAEVYDKDEADEPAVTSSAPSAYYATSESEN